MLSLGKFMTSAVESVIFTVIGYLFSSNEISMKVLEAVAVFSY